MDTQQSEYGIQAYWMPYTANRRFKADPRIITGAQGAYYIDDKGRKIFDGLSGLWTCGAGHNRTEIANAVEKQLLELDYTAFQYGHPKAFELAERLATLAPEDINKVFFVNSGSEASDTATKIARAYWRQRKPTKTRIIGRIKGYHGASWGGISWGGINGNRKMWGQAMEADHLATRYSLTRRSPEVWRPQVQRWLTSYLNLSHCMMHPTLLLLLLNLFWLGWRYRAPEGYLQRLRAIL